MQIRPKIFTLLNLIAVTIPLCFLAVFLYNPGFGVPLYLLAAIAVLFMGCTALIGLLFVIFKKYSRLDYNDYFAVGIMALFSGISGIIIEIVRHYDRDLSYFIYSLLIIGVYIVGDTFLSSKKSA